MAAACTRIGISPPAPFHALRRDNVGYATILYEEAAPVGTITLNRPDDGNMFTATMCHEIRDCINAIRRETRTRVRDPIRDIQVLCPMNRAASGRAA